MTLCRHLAALFTCIGLVGCCQDPSDPLCILGDPERDGGCWSAQTEPVTTHALATGPAELLIEDCGRVEAGYCTAGHFIADPGYWLAPEARHIPAGVWIATAQTPPPHPPGRWVSNKPNNPSVNSAKLVGLVTNASAPASKLSARSSGRVDVVSTATGSPANPGVARIISSTSSPVRRGMLMSSSTRSGGASTAARSFSIACCPSRAMISSTGRG